MVQDEFEKEEEYGQKVTEAMHISLYVCAYIRWQALYRNKQPASPKGIRFNVSSVLQNYHLAIVRQNKAR